MKAQKLVLASNMDVMRSQKSTCSYFPQSCAGGRFVSSVKLRLMQSFLDAGELVSHGGDECVFDFAPASADTTKLQWAAMYGNCLHEVREVTKGYRATITFSILQEKRESSDSDSDSDVRASPDNVPEQDYRITFDKDFRYNCLEMEVGCLVP
jgi:hypothetical protein